MTYRVGKYTLPEYSVLMSVYDRELPENLNESLESMLMQSYPPSDFVLVCDGKLTCELNISGRVQAYFPYRSDRRECGRWKGLQRGHKGV